MTPLRAGPLLLYDARCSVCRRFVEMVVRADHAGKLRIAPLRSVFGDAVRRERTEFSAIDSAIWIPEDGPAVHRSAAVLGVLSYLGGGWRILAGIGRLVPRPLRDALYRGFAGNRSWFAWMGLDEFDSYTRSRILPDDVVKGTGDAQH